jgi:hypothetical protein
MGKVACLFSRHTFFNCEVPRCEVCWACHVLSSLGIWPHWALLCRVFGHPVNYICTNCLVTCRGPSCCRHEEEVNFKFPYQSFIHSPTDAQVNCLKNNIKIHIKIYIKTAPTCFGAVTPSSGSALFVLAKVTVVKIANYGKIHRCVVMWLHILVGPCWCVYVVLFGSRGELGNALTQYVALFGSRLYFRTVQRTHIN